MEIKKFLLEVPYIPNLYCLTNLWKLDKRANIRSFILSIIHSLLTTQHLQPIHQVVPFRLDSHLAETHDHSPHFEFQQ